jgi:hypothetical protein
MMEDDASSPGWAAVGPFLSLVDNAIATEAARTLDSPHVVHVYDHEAHDAISAVSLEFLELIQPDPD